MSALAQIRRILCCGPSDSMWRYVAVHLEGERTDIALIEFVKWTRIDSRSRTDSNSTTGEFCETDARTRWDLWRSMLFVRAIEGTAVVRRRAGRDGGRARVIERDFEGRCFCE